MRRLGLRFGVLDAGPEIGHVWQSRWDSLRLFTPARYDALPGMTFPGRPDTHPGKDAVADYLRDYAAAFNLPVRTNSRVTRLCRTHGGEGYQLLTADRTLHARQVVIATGPFQTPAIPTLATGLNPTVTQLHSAQYRNPSNLPAGPVLVVGDGNSGRQIAAELAGTRPVGGDNPAISIVVPSRLNLWASRHVQDGHQPWRADMEPLTYTVDEVGVLLGVARSVAYEGVRNGSIPATRVGRRWLIPRTRFHEWLNGRRSTDPLQPGEGVD